MENSKVIDIVSKIVSVSLNKEKKEGEVLEKVIATDIKLPADAPARMKTLKAEGKKWYLTVVLYEDTKKPFALFCHTNHREQTAQTSDAVCRLKRLAEVKGILQEHIDKTLLKIEHETNVTKLTRIISLLLRHGILIKNIVKELDKMEDIGITSFLFQLKKFLSQYIQDGEEVEDEACSECGGTLVFSEGCMMCRDCGNSKCG